MMLVNCSYCHIPLQLPPGAECIRCAICRVITLIADPHTALPPVSAYSNRYNVYPPPPPPVSAYNNHYYAYPPPAAPVPAPPPVSAYNNHYYVYPPPPAPVPAPPPVSVYNNHYNVYPPPVLPPVSAYNNHYYVYPPPSAPAPVQSPKNCHSTSGQNSSSHGGGRKRAVIVGISYKNAGNELKGCINDAKCMKFLLTNRFNFPQDSILMLTDEERDPNRIPTKHNILLAMDWLMQGCQAGDSLVFHFSGHGSQQKNDTGDELDGFDETLCPLDVETQGMIVDDEINRRLVRPLPFGAKLHAIIDACHSGTMLDLQFICKMNSTEQYKWEDHYPPRSGASKGTGEGEVISFSGCDDDQESAENPSLSKVTSTGVPSLSEVTSTGVPSLSEVTSTGVPSLSEVTSTGVPSLSEVTSTGVPSLSEVTSTGVPSLSEVTSTGVPSLSKVTSTGLMTYSFIKAIEDEQGTTTYGNILNAMRSFIGSSDNNGIRIRQEPQLTANKQFDVYKKPFSL